MSSELLYPTLIGELGQPIASDRPEDGIEAHAVGRDNAYAAANLPPLGWNHGRPDSSRMIGWTLHRKGSNTIVESHAFSINPQAITRTDSTRNQMFATQGGFYVDDFGPGPITIQINQLVAHGRASAGGGGALSRATMREDVIRFYDLIYTKKVADPDLYDVWFHDNHLWDQVNGKTPERVYFPPQAWQLVRSVQQHNVWQIQLTMITLDAPPRAAKTLPRVPGQPRIRVYVVRKGDTLKKIATRITPRSSWGPPTHQEVLKAERQIIALTKKYGKDDITKKRTIPLYAPGNPQTHIGDATVTRMHVHPGEKIILPTR